MHERIVGGVRPPESSGAKPGELENRGWNLVGAALQMTSRLRDHIERLDEGAVYAVDDLAVVLRALVCSGKGNRVLMRLCDSTGGSLPRARVSRPAPADDDVFFAVGSIPTSEAGASADGAVQVSLTKWMSLRVLTIQSSGSRITYTWDQFLRTYAEKWGGAHLDPAVPAHLRMIDNHAAAGLPLSNYLLRTAAVAVWTLAQNLFRSIFASLTAKESTTGKEVAVAHLYQQGVATYMAPGGIGSSPRDISNRGALQAFCHRTASADPLWYVDESRPDNTLHLALGQASYDVRYSNENVLSTQGPVEVQAQRQPDRSTPINVKPGSLKQIPINGQIRTLIQVRARAANPPA